jgi:PAS domain S-box-containing protein
LPGAPRDKETALTLRIGLGGGDPAQRRALAREIREAWPQVEVVEEPSGMPLPELDLRDARFRALADASSLMVWVSDAVGRLVFANKRWLEFAGRSLAEEYGEGWLDGVHPDDRVRVRVDTRVYEGRREPYALQYRILDARGEYRTIVDSASPLDAADGKPLGYVGTTLDITDQLAAEQRRLEAEVLLTTVLEAAPVGVGFVDPELRYVRVNSTLASFHGLAAEAHIGRSVMEVLEPLGVDVEHNFRRVLATGAPVTGIDVAMELAGGSRRFMVSYHPVHVDGRLSGVGIVAVDTTEREQLESQLLQSQKLEALGRLAGGLAHDFNNLLGVIDGYAHLVADDLPEDDERRAHVLEISRASQRGADLTRQLLSFSRQQVISMSDVDLVSVVGDLARLLQRLVPSNVDLQVVSAAESAFVHGDVGRLGQVLVNLVINAVDAMPSGGDLTVRVDGDEAEVLLSVADTGTGIDDDALPRIFEPFYTTKERGSGLGLATVYGVVEQFGGRVTVESSPGAGSIFVVALPRAVGAAVAEEVDVAHGPTEAGRSETVLVAEDNELLRTLIGAVLERAGYVVRLASDGEGAMESVESEGPPALVVADVEMPRLGGLELSRRLEERCPGVPVLLVSGDAADGVIDDLARHEFLHKPFTPQQLTERVGTLLAGRTGPGPRRALR